MLPFNKTNILPDYLFPFRELDIQAFLIQRQCFLSNYPMGGRPFNDVLRGICAQHNVNPRLLLVSLQREQSLISKSFTPTNAVLDRGLGFGCTDGGDLKQFYGFELQLNKCAQYYRRFFDRFVSGHPMKIDGGVDTVIPENAFTAALYEYTPWAGNTVRGKNIPAYGNYLTWLIWKRYWPEDLHDAPLA